MQELLKNPNFHLLLGIHAGDGSLVKWSSGCKWRFSDSSRDAVIKVSEIVTKLFGFKPKISKDKRNKCWYAIVSKKKFCEMMNNFGFPYGRKLNKLHVPAITKSSNILSKKMFLNGLFGCEATIYKKFYKSRKRYYLIMRLSMCDKNFILEVENLLKEVGINYSVFSENPSKSSFSKNKRYVIAIFGSNVNKFMREIGSWHPLLVKKFHHLAELVR